MTADRSGKWGEIECSTIARSSACSQVPWVKNHERVPWKIVAPRMSDFRGIHLAMAKRLSRDRKHSRKRFFTRFQFTDEDAL